MQPITTLLQSQLAESAAINRMAYALLRWTNRAPVRPGLFGWRSPGEAEEVVLVYERHGLMMAEFGREMFLAEVVMQFPACEWARINRGGMHEPG